MKCMEQYDALLDGQIELPSRLMAMVPPDREPPGISDVSMALEEHLPELRSFDPQPKEYNPGSKWQASVQVDWGGEDGARTYMIWLEYKEEVNDFHFRRMGFSRQEQDTTLESVWTVGVDATLGENSLVDFHRQLKFLDALALDPPTVMDVAACTLHPGSWVREAATSNTPPEPTNLFSIHAVYDEDNEESPVWLHTHGLLRCDCFELEMPNVSRQSMDALGELLNTIAVMALSYGMPPPDEPFKIASGLDLVWLPYEKGLRYFAGNICGAHKDRDEFHCHPSGMILRRSRLLYLFKTYSTPNDFAALFDDNPLMGISNEETERMSSLAHERLDHFRRYFTQYRDAEGWSFLVKLGYKVDQAADDTEREHLWFMVHELEAARVDATLLNQPYNIARMNEGDRKWHSLDLLTDWAVMCKHGAFSPDKISLLEKELAKE